MKILWKNISTDICNSQHICGAKTNLLIFTHTPSERSVGLQMDIFSFSSLFQHLQLFVPTRPKKAQVLFLPGRKSSSFVPTRPKKAQVFVSLRYRKRCEVGRRVGPSLSMRSCFFFFSTNNEYKI